MEKLIKLNALYVAELAAVRAEYANITLAAAVALVRETDAPNIASAFEIIAKRRAVAKMGN